MADMTTGYNSHYEVSFDENESDQVASALSDTVRASYIRVSKVLLLIGLIIQYLSGSRPHLQNTGCELSVERLPVIRDSDKAMIHR